MDWYKHYPGDYMSDTAHLTLLEHGAYRLMLDHYYSTQKPLPSDKSRIYRLVRAVTTEEINAVDSILSEYFVLKDGGYSNAKCNEIIEKYEAQADHNREVGKLGGRPKKPGNNPERNPGITTTVSKQEPGNIPIQILDTRNQSLDNQKPEKNKPMFVLPDWIPKDLWDEWMTVRKKKKAVNTVTALNGLIRNLDNIRCQGLTVEYAITTAIEKSWQGIQFEWLLPDQEKGNGKKLTSLEVAAESIRRHRPV